MKKKSNLSRDAQVVAVALFASGKPAQLTFRRAHIIHPRTRAAIDELAAAGMIKPLDMPAGSAGWEATEKIGFPLRDFKHPTKADSFPITTE